MHLLKLFLKGAGALIRSQREKQALPDKIMKKGGVEGEMILFSKSAWTGRRLVETRGPFVLTTRRIAYFGSGYFKSLELHLPLWQISDVSFESGMFGVRHLSLRVADKKNLIAVEGASILEEMLPAAIAEATQSGDFPVF